MKGIKNIYFLNIALIVYLKLFIGLSNCYNSEKILSNGIIGEMELSSIKLPILGHDLDNSRQPGFRILDNNTNIDSFKRDNNSEIVSFSDSEVGEVVKSRSKRFIYFNVNSALDFGFLLTIPITIVLPPMSNLFNSWKYSKRSARSLMEDEENVLEEDSPVIQPYLDRVNSYFELIKVIKYRSVNKII